MARRRETKWLKAARADADRPAGAPKADWISRALSRAGVLPRAEAEAAVRAGRVRMDGREVTLPLAPYRPGQRVTLDGHPVSLSAVTRVLMFHKPAGAVTAPKDEEGEPTVFDLLLMRLPVPLRGYGWHAVGRLDRDTTGLLLFTNDERFVAFATAPATHLPKRYLATVQGGADDAKLQALRKGMVLDDGPTRPATAVLRGPSLVELTLTEGRHHQVKRMLGAVGLPVRGLHREAVGELVLDIPLGEVRELREDELRDRLGFAPA